MIEDISEVEEDALPVDVDLLKVDDAEDQVLLFVVPFDWPEETAQELTDALDGVFDETEALVYFGKIETYNDVEMAQIHEDDVEVTFERETDDTYQQEKPR